MGRFTEEELKIAKSVDLVDLAENVHIPLKRKGNVYCLQEMDSAVIFNRATWYRYSQSVGGSTIDFLMYFENMRYDEAVSYLLDFAGYIKMNPQDQTTRRKKKEPARPKPKKKAFVLPDRSGTCRGIYAYLIKQRKLSKKVIRYWVEQDLMYESLPYHNIVFLGKAADGKVRFASQRGIRDAYGKVFKGDVEGNDKKYGVNLIHKGNETLNVYEAAIDAMSDMDFRSDYGMNILALGMVSDGPLQTILHEYPEDEMFYDLSVTPIKGNETFKAEAAMRIQNIFVVYQMHVIQGWNGNTFVGMPQKTNTQKGQKEDIAHAVTADFKKELDGAVMEEYHRIMEVQKQAIGRQNKTAR